MKQFLRVMILMAGTGFSVFGQLGCTDPTANNYSVSATVNDGSCTYNATTQSVNVKGSIVANVTESSGLVFTNGVMWTHNDSGNPANIFKIDTANGNVLQTVSITNYPNVDWEDITADSNYIYVGDCGNNNGTRTDLKILKIAKSQLTSTASAITATAQAINFSYSDQTSFASNSANNFDCESIVSIGNFIYLFTKDRGDFQTRVYKLSKTPGTYTLSPYTSYNVNGKLTGADYNPQTKEVVLIGYMASNKNSFLWLLNDFTGDMFFSGNKHRIEIGNSTNDWQTEAITYGVAGELFLSCETSYTTATLYNTKKSSMLIAGIKESVNAKSEIEIYPNPSSGHFKIESSQSILKIEIFTVEGKSIYAKSMEQNSIEMNTSDFTNSAGYYFIEVETEKAKSFQKLIVNPE